MQSHTQVDRPVGQPSGNFFDDFPEAMTKPVESLYSTCYLYAQVVIPFRISESRRL